MPATPSTVRTIDMPASPPMANLAGALNLTGRVLVVGAILVVGCSQPTSPPAAGAAAAKARTTGRIVMLTNGDDPFADIIAEGLHDEAKQLDLAARGLSVVVDKNNGTINGQFEKLRGYAVQDDVRAVAVSVIQADNAAIAEAMKALGDRGTPVITVDSDLSAAVFPDSWSWYVGTDNLVAGRVLGRTLARLRVVVPPAASPVNPAVFEGMPVGLLTLADFEAWLTEEGLTGS